MNILFISLSSLPHMSENSISLDLINEFVNRGHNVYVLCSNEKRLKKETCLNLENNCYVLRVKTGNLTKTNFIEKGISSILLPIQYKKAMYKYFRLIKFDLILYPTPPVTHASLIKYLKNKNHAITYLLLKDIFPQNAVDLNILSKSGIKKLIYKYFRFKEKQLYAVSDYIGCMSPANVKYILEHNPKIKKDIVEVCPNSIKVLNKTMNLEEKKHIRIKYGIPVDKKVFIYGGNLGKPQGIEFIIECLKQVKNLENAFFIIIGNGTEYNKLKEYLVFENPSNIKLMKRLPKNEYDSIVAASDIGLIFLDNCFSIPNFPSRILSYMQSSLPVLACTDVNTDMGEIITNADFGWWCESKNSIDFKNKILEICKSDLEKKRVNSFVYLEKNYSVKQQCEIILNHVKNKNYLKEENKHESI